MQLSSWKSLFPSLPEERKTAPQAPALPHVLPEVCAWWKLERIRLPPSCGPAADVALSLGHHGENVGTFQRARAGEKPSMPKCQRGWPPAGMSSGALWARGLEREQRGPHQQVLGPLLSFIPRAAGVPTQQCHTSRSAPVLSCKAGRCCPGYLPLQAGQSLTQVTQECVALVCRFPYSRQSSATGEQP